MKTGTLNKLTFGLLICITLLLSYSCEDSDNTLAPYVGSPEMSGLLVEESFTPRITWIGGYVTALGINRGSKAAFDSTLVWLIYAPSNGIRYPVQYGELPAGAQDLTANYGGVTIPELIEDEVFTFWVLKEDVWSVVTSNPDKIIVLDSLLREKYLIVEDSIKLSEFMHVQKTQSLDNYINIIEVSMLGRKLGDISVEQPKTSNNPVIRWTITQSGVTDSSISAMGIVEGNQYSSSFTIWEVYSEVDVNGTLVYGEHNVISPPVTAGEVIPETKIFVEYPAIGLERNKEYYVWIASKEWDQVTRGRFTDFYSYITFKTN